MLGALSGYFVGGIKTNLGLFRRILEDEAFRRAAIDTGWLERVLAHPAPAQQSRVPAEIAAIAAAWFASRKAPDAPAAQSAVESAWALAGRREGLR
jgi:acetyl-CoA carboxylase biotin carboxylase subunit